MTFENAQLIQEIGKLSRFASRLCRNRTDAEDLVQDTIVRALERREMFETGSNLFGWTSKMMFNLFVTRHRRKSRHESRFALSDEMLDKKAEEGPQEALASVRQLDQRIQALTPDHREIIIMIDALGMQYQEAASALGIPVGTVRSRLGRARKELRRELSCSVSRPVTGALPGQLEKKPAYLQSAA